MATVNILSWNIEVFGPKKYGSSLNNLRLMHLIGAVSAQAEANVVVLMELCKSVADQISFTVCEALAAYVGGNWTYYCHQARPDGDRESYAIFYRSDLSISVAVDNDGNPYVDLSSIDFPCRWFNAGGRRPLLGLFNTSDTNTTFVVSVYHAPPNAQAINGVESLAKTPWLYSFGDNLAVTGRLLAGDYNLDVTVQDEFSWLTNPVITPPGPPPDENNGAGTTAATTAYTHLMDLARVRASQQADPNWGTLSTQYQNLRLDNIFYCSSQAQPQAQSTVVDLVAQVMDGTSAVRQIMQNYDVFDDDGLPVFANAGDLTLPLNTSLDNAFDAWLITRYGISDHLPVLLSINL